MVGQIVTHSPNVGMKQDHHSFLARLLAEVSRDHAQLRMFVYEFARAKLRKDLYWQFVEGGWSEIAEQVNELEAAINQIEADFAQNGSQLRFNSEPTLTPPIQERSTQNALVMRPGSQNAMIFGDDGDRLQSPISGLSRYEMPASSLAMEAGLKDPFEGAILEKHLRSRFWRNTQLIIAAILGAVIYVVIDPTSSVSFFGSNWLYKSMNVGATNDVAKEQNVVFGAKELGPKTDAAFRAAAPNFPLPTEIPPLTEFPLPTEYGVYAVIHGRLTELDQLPIKPPDQRVAISASIPTPSRVHLPLGQLQFVVFRRDLATNAPDRVSLRVVARVARALTFNSTGNAKVASVDGSWVIRSNSYQMRVGPVVDNPEMIIIRPDADVVFPAGRYALVLKGVAYDFTIDGPLTDPAHCLERTDALNTPVYTECRKL